MFYLAIGLIKSKVSIKILKLLIFFLTFHFNHFLFGIKAMKNILHQTCELNCLYNIYSGHLESLQFLISSLNADFTSSLDYQNILHVACQSQRTPDHLVKYCIEMARSALSWDMVNHQDIQVQ